MADGRDHISDETLKSQTSTTPHATAEALERAIKHTRKRFSEGTPEKYPGTPLYGLRLLEADALAAELASVRADLETAREALNTLRASVCGLNGCGEDDDGHEL